MRITAHTRDSIMAALIAATGPFDPTKVFVGVAQSIANQGVGCLIEDVVPATGAAGTRTAVATWSAPYTLTDGRRVVDAPAKLFRPAPGDEQQQVQSWYLADAATAGLLLGSGDLPDLVLLPDESAAVTVIVRITVDPNGQWSAEVVYNG